MLQPNPVKRIKLKEIKEHPWYLQSLPRYLADLSCVPMKYEMQVDTDIVKKLFEVSWVVILINSCRLTKS